MEAGRMLETDVTAESKLPEFDAESLESYIKDEEISAEMEMKVIVLEQALARIGSQGNTNDEANDEIVTHNQCTITDVDTSLSVIGETSSDSLQERHSLLLECPKTAVKPQRHCNPFINRNARKNYELLRVSVEKGIEEKLKTNAKLKNEQKTTFGKRPRVEELMTLRFSHNKTTVTDGREELAERRGTEEDLEKHRKEDKPIIENDSGKLGSLRKRSLYTIEQEDFEKQRSYLVGKERKMDRPERSVSAPASFIISEELEHCEPHRDVQEELQYPGAIELEPQDSQRYEPGTSKEVIQYPGVIDRDSHDSQRNELEMSEDSMSGSIPVYRETEEKNDMQRHLVKKGILDKLKNFVRLKSSNAEEKTTTPGKRLRVEELMALRFSHNKPTVTNGGKPPYQRKKRGMVKRRSMYSIEQADEQEEIDTPEYPVSTTGSFFIQEEAAPWEPHREVLQYPGAMELESHDSQRNEPGTSEGMFSMDSVGNEREMNTLENLLSTSGSFIKEEVEHWEPHQGFFVPEPVMIEPKTELENPMDLTANQKMLVKTENVAIKDETLIWSSENPWIEKRIKMENAFSKQEIQRLRVPLDRNWTRLLVYRKTGKKKGDTYYIPPEGGKKLRSIPDIQKYFELQPGLHLMDHRNFSFRDLPLLHENQVIKSD